MFDGCCSSATASGRSPPTTFVPSTVCSRPHHSAFSTESLTSRVTGCRAPAEVNTAWNGASSGGSGVVDTATGRMSPNGVPPYAPSENDRSPPTITKACPCSTT
jgi:hypothetical protein